jgi:hypothetical protein
MLYIYVVCMAITTSYQLPVEYMIDWQTVSPKIGVRQGDILSPLIFDILNDFSFEKNVHVLRQWMKYEKCIEYAGI